MSSTTDEKAPTSLIGAPRISKAAIVAKLLTRARGATLAEIETATSWQAHSVRAHLSGLRKRGQTLAKEQRKGGETSYRLATVDLSPTNASNHDA